MFWLGGDGPKDIPWPVHRHLVNTLNVPFQSLKGLRSVQKVGLRDGKPVVFFRIYDADASRATTQVKDFASLDLYPELILYEGYWEKRDDSVYLERASHLAPE